MIILSFDVGIKNLAYCIYDSKLKVILDWNILDCSVNKNENNILKLIEQLDLNPQLLDIDLVLIEKQPSFNPQMRIISNCLYVYFTMRIIYEQDRKIRILYYSPKKKLNLCLDTESYQKNLPILKKKDKTSKSQRYRNNKKAAVEQTIILLEDTNKFNNLYINYFNSSKKKDDLADSFLQIISFLNN